LHIRFRVRDGKIYVVFQVKAAYCNFIMWIKKPCEARLLARLIV
jgi:hypothetical protein